MSQSPHPQSITDSDTMLDVYILDYLTKRKLNASKKAFGEEAKVPFNHPAIDAPRGFLFEWWTVFWDIFISRYKHHQGYMELGNEVSLFSFAFESCGQIVKWVKWDESKLQDYGLLNLQEFTELTNSVSEFVAKINLQVLDFRVAQNQRQGSQQQSQHVNNAVTGKNAWVAEASNPTRQAVQKHGDNVRVLTNHINPINHQPTELPNQSVVPTLDINSMMSSFINQSGQGCESLPSGAPAGTGVLNNLPLKGWPLTGPDQIWTRNHQQKGALHPPPLSIQGQNQPPNERETSQTEGQLQPPMEKKRKQQLMSSSVGNSSGTADVAGGFSNLAEASQPPSPHNDKINIDDFLNYGALEGDDNSLLSRPGKEADVDTSHGFTFSEIASVHATNVSCCDISFDGKLVAVGGKDKKARLWCTNSLETKGTFDGHSQAITDIRFSPSMLRLATSSLDKTIKIWDLENPGSSIKTFTGHTTSVMSLDFNPKKEDLLCSCDETEIRYWTIKNAGCFKVSKGGANLVRFQSGTGRYLASVVGKSVCLFDLENTHARRNILKGHESNVQSLCWDSSGELLISVSEDLLKVWKMDIGGKASCIHEFSVPGKRFRCGIFHPHYPSLLVIGCYQSMELWNMTENKIMTPVEEPISALVVSSSGLIASAGHNDNVLKLWK
ncbi:hypothetical protein SSX86_009875 [Deinandra increscens subsp. villosa]|uniref:Uncharacterized protein n=1 Tax=Deinandra increscens subsp. villosa TaxID=3103831 RepID=A0AAP0H4G7_9ASTR